MGHYIIEELIDPKTRSDIWVVPQCGDKKLSLNDTGPLPWDAPNRLLSWGYLPAWSKNWSVGYMLDWHTGLPFSIEDDYGPLVEPWTRSVFQSSSN